MRKIKTLLKAPVLVQSGYSIHSRQILKALLKDPIFDVYVENINWGACSFLVEDNEEKQTIKTLVERRVIEKHQGNNKFDLFIHVTIPNEFERQATFNVGVTAGIETDRVSHVWVQKCNEMDLVIVPSQHSKKVLEDTTIEWQNPQTGQSGQFKVQKPIVVCNEGVDTSIFHPADKIMANIGNLLEELPDFNFLHVGQWGKGGYGEDRKNIALLVKYFIETFKGRKDVGLIMKINMARNSIVDYEHTVSRLKEIKANFKQEEVPPIFLLHASLSDAEMSSLYRHPKVKAMISLTHGEGFGLPLIEAAACDLPVMATNWSGHLDFLKYGKFIAFDYELKEIPEGAVWENILIKGSRWACIKENDVKAKMEKIVSSSYSKPKEWAKELGEKIREKFNLDAVCGNFSNTIKQHMLQEKSVQIDPLEHLMSFIDTPEDFNVVYTMPMSAGDVLISTAVIDGLVKNLPTGYKIYFATNSQYADILKGNPHIHKVIPWNETMINIDLLEEVFDLALTPNTTTHYTFSNWIRRGQGRLLAEEYANHCQCELGDYFIERDDNIFKESAIDLAFHSDNGVLDSYDSYMTFHPGSGKDKWEARRYDDWQEVLNNIKEIYPNLKIVQIGAADEPKFENIDIDLRGKVNYQSTASIVGEAKLHLSIDTFTMHLAAALNTPLVALFGCSYATSTGPWVKDKNKANFVLLQSERLSGCKDKACYKNRCIKNPDYPPINEIDPKQVVASCCAILGRGYGNKFETFETYPYKRAYRKISGYTTTYNAIDYPFEECVRSMLGFCDEVVVVDGCSTDGTHEALQKLAEEDSRIKIYQNEFNWEEPGVDGLQKAFARTLCENEFLWQMDCDEVVHEDDYEKIKLITKRFPKNFDILHLPIVELWSTKDCVTGRRHAWKWRMSRNKTEITHGINKDARLTNEKTGKTYAKKGMSDGCEYVHAMTYEMLQHTGFYNNQLDMIRVHMPERYAKGMNEVFKHIPSVYHYSWYDLARKINQLKAGGVWDKMWSLLYQEETQNRFEEIKTESDLIKLCNRLESQGGEDSDKVKYKFKLEKSHPKIMENWIKKAKERNTR